jgi:alpha-tubulin suppressor-like RCC1 family protein
MFATAGQGGETLLSVMIPPARAFAIGEHHGCALLQKGGVSCWGWNRHGEIGRTPRDDYEPQPAGLVEGLPQDIDSLAVGPSVSCAIVRGSELWCWGIAPHLSSWDASGLGKPMQVPIDP